MKNALLLALAALPLVACGGAIEGEPSVDENVGTAESELANPYPTAYLVNFDQDTSGSPLANGTIIDTTYASLGVTFSGTTCVQGQNCTPGHAFARTSVASASPPNVVAQNATSLPFFNDLYGEVRADFATAKSWASIDLKPVLTAADFGDNPTAQPWFGAYDANDTVIAKLYYPIAFGGTNWGSYQTLRIDAGTARIKYVRFSAQGPGSAAQIYGEFDNMRFSSGLVKLCPYKFGC